MKKKKKRKRKREGEEIGKRKKENKKTKGNKRRRELRQKRKQRKGRRRRVENRRRQRKRVRFLKITKGKTNRDCTSFCTSFMQARSAFVNPNYLFPVIFELGICWFLFQICFLFCSEYSVSV